MYGSVNYLVIIMFVLARGPKAPVNQSKFVPAFGGSYVLFL